MNLIKVKDINNDVFYINEDAINMIQISNGRYEGKYLVVLCDKEISVKKSRGIDTLIENLEWVENLFEDKKD